VDAFKFTLGPYELFALTIDGVPLVLVTCLLYDPVIALQGPSSISQDNFSIQLVIVFVVLSYILGGTVQGLTWKYFLFLCKLFKKDYRYASRRELGLIYITLFTKPLIKSFWMTLNLGLHSVATAPNQVGKRYVRPLINPCFNYF
jgi:hypothetical protein